MPYATEAALRLKFQLTSTTDFPAAFLNDAIAQAHAELLPRLHTVPAPEDAPESLTIGEILLAGARVFQHLAARDAATLRTATIGGQRLDTAPRHAQLALSAARAEEHAWQLLHPHCNAPKTVKTLTTDSTPILSAPY